MATLRDHSTFFSQSTILFCRCQAKPGLNRRETLLKIAKCLLLSGILFF